MNKYPFPPKAVFDVTENNFEQYALALFRWQAVHNAIYRQYLDCLNINVQSVRCLDDIPYLPIDFFKRHRVLSVDAKQIAAIFESSGTTQQYRSKHYIASTVFYHQVCRRIFEQRFDHLTSYHLMALLPSYLERKNASLVSMVDYLMKESQSDQAGFYLDDYARLIRAIGAAQKTGRSVMLIGVTFALLKLAEYAPDLRGVTILETGGMKGMHREMTRAEVYEVLHRRTAAEKIYSEYGMTELLSQAYTDTNGLFCSPAWMRVSTREIDDPMTVQLHGRVGGNQCN